MEFTLSSSFLCSVVEEMHVFTRELIICMSDCAGFAHEGKKTRLSSHKKAGNSKGGVAGIESSRSRR